ncbi:MAG: hypothetical protein JWO15_3596 [Sphingomonadales bacterium]|nr:hypothetical protein [Sphingomonadales bacterium]
MPSQGSSSLMLLRHQMIEDVVFIQTYLDLKFKHSVSARNLVSTKLAHHDRITWWGVCSLEEVLLLMTINS